MTRIKMHISKVKLPFYPPCEVKCELQNRVSKQNQIQNISNQTRVILKRLNMYNLSKLYYLTTRYAKSFQAIFSHHFKAFIIA